MAMNTQGRPSRPLHTPDPGAYEDTFSGSKGLDQAEPLIFERRTL
jgi:glycine dehydrogenase subunit 2